MGEARLNWNDGLSPVILSWLSPFFYERQWQIENTFRLKRSSGCSQRLQVTVSDQSAFVLYSLLKWVATST